MAQSQRHLRSVRKIVTEGTVTTNTNYLDGFQYKNTVLEFFPTAEGYVKNTAGALSYVFQYKDPSWRERPALERKKSIK